VLSPLEGYNRWAASYGTESNPVKVLSDDLIKKFLPDLKGKAVLDAGCGVGKFCVLAESQQASSVVGIDLSPAMIDEARRHCPHAEFRCGDLGSVVMEPARFDVIICSLVLAHIENFEPALQKLVRALREGGVLLITDFHPFLTLQQSKRTFRDESSGKTYEVQHYLHLFQDYFRIFREERITLEFFEEPRFQGSPVIFGLRARKQ